MRFGYPKHIGTWTERRGEENVACHHHGWSLDTTDSRVFQDDDGNYFCDEDCYREWLREQQEDDEAEGESVPAVA